MPELSFTYDLDDGTLECLFDYEAPERGSWQGGQQIEPDWPENFILNSVKAGEIELIDYLDEAFKERILDAIQTNYPQDEPDYDPPEYDYYEER